MIMMKVFDCQEMPDEVRSEFFGWACAANDCYVAVTVEFEEWCPKMIVSWLLANGAEESETVLIEHWW